MVRPEDIGLMKCGALRTGRTGPVVFYTEPHLREYAPFKQAEEKMAVTVKTANVESVCAL